MVLVRDPHTRENARSTTRTSGIICRGRRSCRSSGERFHCRISPIGSESRRMSTTTGWINGILSINDSCLWRSRAERGGQPCSVGLFLLSSLGIATNRDPWVYQPLIKTQSLSPTQCREMIASYEERRSLCWQVKADSLEQATRNDASNRRSNGLEGLRYRHSSSKRSFQLELRLACLPSKACIAHSANNMSILILRHSRIVSISHPSMFPRHQDAPKPVIGVTGRGQRGFSVLDDRLLSQTINLLVQALSGSPAGVTKPTTRTVRMPGFTSGDEGLGARARLPARRQHHRLVPAAVPPAISRPADHKDDIWHYIYGLLHAPDYREKYRADLSKDLPRIPFAPDFGAFRDAGEQLAGCTWGMRPVRSMNCRWK